VRLEAPSHVIFWLRTGRHPVRAVPWAEDSRPLWSEGCPAPALSRRVPRPNAAAAAAGPARGRGAWAAWLPAHPMPAGTGSVFVR